MFDKVVISFDGPTREELAADLLNSDYSKFATNVLITPKEMSVVEHWAWMYSCEPLVTWDASQLVMLLAEDDLICIEALGSGLEALKASSDSILWGSWDLYRNLTDRTSSTQLSQESIEIFDAKQICSRLEKWVNAGHVTTISGITAQTEVFRSYARLMVGGQASDPLMLGVRAEYFFATHPSIKRLIRSIPPIVHIQEHADQEGKILPAEILSQDEFLYQLWLLAFVSQARLRDRTLPALRIMRRFARKPSTVRLLPRALRTFSEVKNGV